MNLENYTNGKEDISIEIAMEILETKPDETTIFNLLNDLKCSQGAMFLFYRELINKILIKNQNPQIWGFFIDKKINICYNTKVQWLMVNLKG